MNFTDNKLTIGTFNDDRSLEQYLGRALVEAEAEDTEPWWRFGRGIAGRIES